MSAIDHIHPALRDKVRFVLNPQSNTKDYSPHASIEARHSDTNEVLGYFDWDSKHVVDVAVHDGYGDQLQAQGLPNSGDLKNHGLGTALWVRAQQAHADEPYLYPKPQHSKWRTDQGNSWAYHLYMNGLGEYPPENEME